MDTPITTKDLKSLSTSELVELFAQLECPTVAEMKGEYSAQLLTQPNWLFGVVGRFTLNNPLQRWLTKSFRPIDDASGRGYNSFQQGSRVVQRYAMGTRLAPSRFDGKPAFQLIYRQFYSVCGTINMVDEIRRAAPGVYLGFGTFGFTDSQRRIPYPFLLTGPQEPYRSDIGRRRKRFNPGSRELPAMTF